MNSKLQINCTTYRFYIQGISFQGCRHFCDFLLESLDRKKEKMLTATMETTLCGFELVAIKSHTPASSLLPDIWLPGWWSSWAEAGFPCLWSAPHPQTLCTSYWTRGLREKGHTTPTNTCYASGRDLQTQPCGTNISKQPILTWSGYDVSNSTPKYWSIKFFFVQAEAALPSESVCRMENHVLAWATELICLYINQHFTPRGHKMKY